MVMANFRFGAAFIENLNFSFLRLAPVWSPPTSKYFAL